MGSAAPGLQIIPPEGEPDVPQASSPMNLTWVWQWAVGALLVAVVGSWFVWLSAYLQRTFVEDEVRLACQRIMPDTVQRCVDTVVLQRGGSRR